MTKTNIKASVTTDDIQRMVDACFGANTRIGAITPLSGGLFNVVYLIALPDHNLETVLRIAPHQATQRLRYETSIMRTEIAVYELIRQQTSVPLPTIYQYNFKHDIIPHDYMFISKLQGIPLRDARTMLSATEIAALDRELGAYTAQIHAIKGTDFGYFASATRLSWRSNFLQMLTNLLEDGQKAGVPLPYAEIKAAFDHCAVVLDEITEPRLLHGDFWDANVFVQPNPWRIEGIIDCDRAIWGDPEAEFSMLYRAENTAFFEGYGRKLTDTPAAKCRRQMYLAYFMVIVNIESYARVQDITDRTGWARLELDRLVTELQNFNG